MCSFECGCSHISLYSVHAMYTMYSRSIHNFCNDNLYQSAVPSPSVEGSGTKALHRAANQTVKWGN